MLSCPPCKASEGDCEILNVPPGLTLDEVVHAFAWLVISISKSYSLKNSGPDEATPVITSRESLKFHIGVIPAGALFEVEVLTTVPPSISVIVHVIGN